MGWMKVTVMTAAVPAMPTCVNSEGGAAPDVAIGRGVNEFMMMNVVVLLGLEDCFIPGLTW